MSTWPADADGDVLRRMEAGGFDFSRPCLIDFNVDFETWPPADAAFSLLQERYPSLEAYAPSDDGAGYLQFQVLETLSYELVTRIQSEVSESMAPFGGVCESWGVLH